MNMQPNLAGEAVQFLAAGTTLLAEPVDSPGSAKFAVARGTAH